MADPKPIALTQIDEADYDGKGAPQPFVVVGDIPGTGPVAVADVTGLQAIITDLTDRIEALEALQPE